MAITTPAARSERADFARTLLGRSVRKLRGRSGARTLRRHEVGLNAARDAAGRPRALAVTVERVGVVGSVHAEELPGLRREDFALEDLAFLTGSPCSGC